MPLNSLLPLFVVLSLGALTVDARQHSKAFPVLLSADMEVEAEMEVATFLDSRLATSPADDTHPFWIFEWDQLNGYSTVICAITLFLAGLLCSAGGIGGGGVYVTVLMVAGQLSPHNAVPLSKAIVFAGSIASLFRNLGRTLGGQAGEPAKTVIDYNICRLVVPASLIGTLLGVLLNRNAADSAIVMMLSAILIVMTVMVCYTTWNQYQEEEKAASSLLTFDPAPSGNPSDHGGSESYENANESTSEVLLGGPNAKKKLLTKQQTGPQSRDTYVGVLMLFIVVVSGVVRHHASACLWEIQTASGVADREAVCHHPLLAFFVGARAEAWMGDPWHAGVTMFLTLVIPMTVCFAIMVFNGRNCVLEGWSPMEVAKYESMGVVTGCLAGLVGIGGGLIFSPFFLIMGVEPMIAVATSSTCVIFTSSSTTLQYLFTDRIIISLTCVYGVMNVLASYGGTAFVHFLQDRFAARRSYITAIVAAGVMVSAVLSLAKLGSQATSASLIEATTASLL